MDARIAPPFMEATDASRLVCVVVVSYQEYSLTHTRGMSAIGALIGLANLSKTFYFALTARRLALMVRTTSCVWRSLPYLTLP